MVVIGDVVGGGRDLGLQPGPRGELEREGGVDLGQRPRWRGDRPVVLGQPLQRVPAQIQAVEAGVTHLQPGHDPQCLGIMIEAAEGGERGRQGVLAGMTERWMAEIVRQRAGLGEILVQPQRPGDRTGDLRHFETVGQPDAEMVPVGTHEHLRLVAQPTKGG